jgi:hypothetical protein
MKHDFVAGYMSGDNDEQFISVRRSFVKWGGLARLWTLDAGLSVSAAPVFWLLGRGYPDGLAVSRGRIAYLSGISTRAIGRVAANLAAEDVIRPGFSIVAGQVRYAVSTANLWTRDCPDRRMLFPARVISRGLWRSLRRSERSVLLALLALVRVDDLDTIVSCSRLARLAGISAAAASRALNSLADNTSVQGVAPLSISGWGQDGTDVDLDATWWRVWSE